VQDYEAAVQWYRLAADQGLARAQTSLGFMYDNGQGVVQDYEAAVQWYRLAADQGLAQAQNNLGGMYDNGQGVVQDYVQAHMWYNLAAAHLTGSDRDQAVKSRAAVEAKMLPAQVVEAQKMAWEWRPKGENPAP
jgi:TPR repeat protein